MRTIILTQYYPPEIGAPAVRLSALAKRFVERGHEAVVLTAMPSYPFGRVFDGYDGVWRSEIVEGVKVIRSFVYPTQKPTMVARLANYLSFVISSSIIGGILLPSSDFLIVESPPLFLGLSGLLLRRWKKSNLIMNVSDLWPESAVRLNVITRNGMAHKISGRLEAILFNRSALVTCQSQTILSDIRTRFPRVQLFHLSNGVDTRRFHPDQRTTEARQQLGSDAPFIALYAGLLGLAQGLEQVLEALGQLCNEGPYQGVFVGDGPEKAELKELAARCSITNAKFLDPIPHSEIPSMLASADAVLVPLKTYIPGAVPSKLYEAMACAKPVVLIAEGEAAEILEQHHAGIVVRPGDIQGIVNALRTLQSNPKLRKEMGENGRRTVEALYDRQAIIDRFIDYLESFGR